MRIARHATRRSRLLMAWGSVAAGAMLCAASLGGILLASPAASAGASGACPANATCMTMPGGAGEVVATPTSGLSNDQWVDLKFSGFDPGNKVFVYYCADTGPISAGAPNCVEHNTSDLPFPLQFLKIYSTGADAGDGDLPYQVAEGIPLSGFPPGELPKNQNIDCDGTAKNPCEIVVQEPFLGGGLKTITPDSAVAIPIEFASQSGCPGANSISTASEYGIEQLLPVVAQQACATQKSPYLAFNTAIDGEAAVTELASGDVPVAFTDDPGAPDEQAQLSSLKGGYALIPVALSANVIGFRAVVPDYTDEPPLYTRTNYKLTPTQVAGLVSALYTSPTASDLLYCATPTSGGWCADPDTTDCAGNLCSMMAESNANAGFLGPGLFGVSVRSDSSGNTGQLFDWLCNAPNTPYPIFGVTETEPLSASNVLVNGFNTNLPPGDKKFTSCPSTSDTFPSLQSSGTVYYSEVAQPFQQEVKLAGSSGLVQPISQAVTASEVFAPMNWAEAEFNGFQVASLENNRGDFVAPTQTSLDSAIADASHNRDGSLSFDYSGTGSGPSYPTPDLIYAAVSTAPQSASSASQERSMLSSILDVTGGAHSAALPAGFVPLPSSLFAQAENDLETDIVTPSSTPSSSGKKTSTASKVSSTKSTTNPGSPAYPAYPACAACIASAASLLLGRGPSALAKAAEQKAHRGDDRGGAGSQPLPPVAAGVFLEPTADRLLLPSLGFLGALVLLWGLLLLSPPARRRILGVMAAADRGVGRLFGRGKAKAGSDMAEPVGDG